MPKGESLRAIDAPRGRGGGALYVGGAGGGGATVLPLHNSLPGLTVGDPHPQYLTPGRGAALYVPLGRKVLGGAGLAQTNDGGLGQDVALSVGQGEGILVGENEVGLNPSVAGAGLGYNAGVLAVGVANTGAAGLSQEAHAIRLTSSSDPGAAARVLATNAAGEVGLVGAYLQAAYVGTLDMGTDTLYEDADYLQVAGAKPLNFGQVIRGGLNWSMTPAGGLAAQTGNFAGDLYAAASAFRVINHTHDYPHSHVVINPGGSWALDEQFGLDIDDNLLVRGWIVGKHAIALPGATLLLHFDGLLPFETNFTGQLIGHLGQVGTPVGGVIHRPGKFSTKAIQTGAAGTNLVNNPSFENNVTDSWTVAVTGTGGAVVRDAARSYIGGACARITASSGGNYTLRSNAVSLPHGDYVTVQCRLRRGSAINALLIIRDVTNGSNVATASPTLIDEWERLTCTWRNMTGATVTVELRVQNAHGDGAGRVWVDACQLEKTFYMTPYSDGSLGGGHAWSGAAHNSSSTRPAAHVTYLPIGVVRPGAGTIMAWVQTAGITGERQYVADIGGLGEDGMFLAIEADGKPRFYYSSSSTVGVALTAAAAVAPRTWVHLAATWGPTGATLYVNGAAVASGAPAGGTTINAALALGRRYAVAANWFNGWIDDVAFADRVTAADQVRAIYESDAPVFAETSTWHWRAGRNRFWADAEGMWMLNAAGQPMWGAYAGDELDSGASRTWGGVDLAASDILMGDANRGGYVKWDDSAATMEFSGDGGGLTQINGANIVTGSIEADKLDVDDLRAVAAKIANWDLTAGLISSPNIRLFSGDAYAARLELGDGTAARTAGVRAGGAAGANDTALWAGSAHDNTANASWRVTFGGRLFSTSAALGSLQIDTAGAFVEAQPGWNMTHGYKFRQGATGAVAAGLLGRYSLNSYAYLDLVNNVTGTADSVVDSLADSLVTVRGAAGAARTSSVALRAERVSGGVADNVGLTLVNSSAERSATILADTLTWTRADGNKKIWTELNDGTGSGLDADLLDGYHANVFPRLAASNTFDAINTFNNTTVLAGAVQCGGYVRFAPFASAPDFQSGYAVLFLQDGGSGNLQFRVKIRSQDGTKTANTQLAYT
jgi:hypothetical protein